MRVSDLMTRIVISTPRTPVLEARALMQKARIRHHDGRLQGIVTDRDIRRLNMASPATSLSVCAAAPAGR